MGLYLEPDQLSYNLGQCSPTYIVSGLIAKDSLPASYHSCAYYMRALI
jgi:hypothetical protein